MAGTIAGVVGRVKWAYYTAASIDRYTVTYDNGHWRLVGAIAAPDAFKLAQRPLTFEAPHARGAWVWPIVELTITNGTIRATLGPPG